MTQTPPKDKPADVRDRVVQAPPGVPVGQLVACGDADLGAREAIEQRRLAGVRVAGEGDLRQVRALALGAHRGA